MTRADIELMLTNLAETRRYLRETSRLTREAAEHIGRVSDELRRLDVVGTTGGKATVATAVPGDLNARLKRLEMLLIKLRERQKRGNKEV